MAIGIVSNLARPGGNITGVLAVLFTAALAACKTQPSPWSPEVDKLYHQMYGPIIDGG